MRGTGTDQPADDKEVGPIEAGEDDGPSETGRRRRSPAIAAALSFLWPGLGQLAQGRRIAAIVFAVPAVAFVVWVLLQLDQGGLFFAVSLWDGTYAATAIAIVCIFGAWRAASVGQAFYLGSRGRRPRAWEIGVAAVLMGAIVATHGLFVAGAWAWYQTAQSIQSNDLLAEVLATDPPTLPSPTPSSSPQSQPSPTATALPTPEPSPTRPPNPNRITFLIAGTDFMAGRDHSLTDTLVVVSLDTGTGKVAMVSVPRDTSMFDLYWGGMAGPTFTSNTLLNSASTGRIQSPDPPMKTLENEIAFLVGSPSTTTPSSTWAASAGWSTQLGALTSTTCAPSMTLRPASSWASVRRIWTVPVRCCTSAHAKV